MKHFPVAAVAAPAFIFALSPLNLLFRLAPASSRAFRRLRYSLLLVVALVASLSSCVSTKYLQQRTMFQLTKGADGVVDTAKLRRAVNRTARNYLIHANDYLSVQVFTNKGERLIDPNGYLGFGAAATGATTVTRTGGGVGNGAGAVNAGGSYLVQADGTVQLPLLSARVSVVGLSLLQVDSLLQTKYNYYYKESFVKTAVANNRVIILGAPGGLVLPLANDNMNLLEVLALAGGTDGGGGAAGGFSRFGGRVDKIRIIRGDLKNPQVQFIDLSTLEGMRRGNLQVEPNDVIYIQPVRRPFLEGLSDAAPVFSAVSAVIGTVSFIVSLVIISRQLRQ